MQISTTEPCTICNESGETIYRGVELGPCYECHGTKIKQRDINSILYDLVKAVNLLLAAHPRVETRNPYDLNSRPNPRKS